LEPIERGRHAIRVEQIDVRPGDPSVYFVRACSAAGMGPGGDAGHTRQQVANEVTTCEARCACNQRWTRHGVRFRREVRRTGSGNTP
jgi:hypothetical protein